MIDQGQTANEKSHSAGDQHCGNALGKFRPSPEAPWLRDDQGTAADGQHKSRGLVIGRNQHKAGTSAGGEWPDVKT